MVAEPSLSFSKKRCSCSLAKISMVAERVIAKGLELDGCSLAKISMVAEPQNI